MRRRRIVARIFNGLNAQEQAMPNAIRKLRTVISRKNTRTAARIAAATVLICSAAPGHVRAADDLEKPKLQFAILPTMDYVPIVLGLKEGIFAQEGLDASYQISTAPASLNGLLGGTFDAAGVNWFGFLTAYNRGLPLVAVSELDRGSPGYTNFVVKGDSPIKTTADLIGRKVGVLATNGNCDLILNDLMARDHLAYKQVQYVALAVPELVSTLMTGGIDAACVPEPMLTPALNKNGLRKLIDLFSGPYDDFPIVGYSVTKQFKQNNPKTFAALQRALTKSLKLAHDNPDKVRAVLPGYTRIDEEAARAVSLPTYPEVANFGVMKAAADIMNRLNVMGGPVKVPLE
jgi:NitT/TauT family transport system substrate-binding protein